MWTAAQGKVMTKAGRGYGEIVMVFREGKLIKEILQKFLLCSCPEVLRIIVGMFGYVVMDGRMVGMDSRMVGMFGYVGMDGRMVGLFGYVGMDGRMVGMYR